MNYPGKIDLHMHSIVSDGTDSPEAIFDLVRSQGFSLFSVTDHDAIKSSYTLPKLIKETLKRGENCPRFLAGAEFSCKDDEGQYHILGYGYDPQGEGISKLVELGHSYRMEKVRERLEYIKLQYGFDFPREEIDALLALDNPGKPHIGNLMVKYGYAKDKEQAIKQYIDKLRIKDKYVKPREAIAGILASDGIPVLAHPSYGSGDQLILGDAMDKRIKKLMGYGLQGLEAFYSGFTSRLRNEILDFAKRYDLYVTAGSDYHGTNKLVVLGDTGLEPDTELPEGLIRFLADSRERQIG